MDDPSLPNDSRSGRRPCVAPREGWSPRGHSSSEFRTRTGRLLSQHRFSSGTSSSWHVMPSCFSMVAKRAWSVLSWSAWTKTVSGHPQLRGGGTSDLARRQLRRLRPERYILPDLQLERVATSLSERPVIALWCGLFSGVANEPRWDVRIFRLWSTLETIAGGVGLPEGRAFATDGTELELPPRVVAQRRNSRDSRPPRESVYLLLCLGQDALGIPQEIAVTHPDHDVWNEVTVWYSERSRTRSGRGCLRGRTTGPSPLPQPRP